MSWIMTQNKNKVDILNLRPSDIDINDIIYSLSNQCRFNGHCNSFFSVAHHSVMVADLCSNENAFQGLLHDASEAYISDIPAPFKKFLPDYENMEEAIQDCIYTKYNININISEEVMLVDKRCCVTEALYNTNDYEWIYSVKIGNIKIEPYPKEFFDKYMNKSIEEIRSTFLHRFNFFKELKNES